MIKTLAESYPSSVITPKWPTRQSRIIAQFMTRTKAYLQECHEARQLRPNHNGTAVMLALPLIPETVRLEAHKRPLRSSITLLFTSEPNNTASPFFLLSSSHSLRAPTHGSWPSHRRTLPRAPDTPELLAISLYSAFPAGLANSSSTFHSILHRLHPLSFSWFLSRLILIYSDSTYSSLIYV
jgi:hypothetical protein